MDSEISVERGGPRMALESTRQSEAGAVHANGTQAAGRSSSGVRTRAPSSDARGTGAMDLISGAPFWPVRNGLIATYPPLQRSVRCEVAIVGGGVTGACVAHELTEAGVDTVVVDRRDIGTGSTAGSTGLLLYELDTPMRDVARRYGEHNAARAYRACADGIIRIGELASRLSIDCGYRRRECIQGASMPKDVDGLRLEWELHTRNGFAADFWDAARVKAESTLPFHAALVSRLAGEIDPHRFTHGLLRIAAGRGCRVHDRTTVKAYRCGSRGVTLQTDRDAEIHAGWVVVAAGYEAESLLQDRATSLQSTFSIVSEPIDSWPGWPERRLIWETARPYLYLRTTADNRAIIGGGDVARPSARRRERLLPAKARWLKQRFESLFPRIPFETAYAWAGTFASTRDGLPFIGPHPDFPRACFALGYGGNGITFSAVAAGLIRDICTGRRNPHAALFGFGRLGRL